MSIGENIKLKRLALGYTLEDIAKRMQTTRQTIHRYESEVIANIPSDKIEQLADILGVTPSHLMGWDRKIIPQLLDENITIPKEDLPLLEKIVCGEHTFVKQVFEDYIEAGCEINADFALRVKGDSMTGAFIRDGDLVFIRRQNTVEQGEIVAVMIDNEASIKRYFRYGSTIVLRSENILYSDKVIKIGEDSDIRLIGKAVSILSNVR